MFILQNFKKKFGDMLKNNKVLLTVFTKVASIFVRGYGLFFSIDNNQLLITANSMGYNDSPKVIFEEIMKRNKFKDLKIIWALNNKEDMPKKYRDRVEVIKPDTLKYFKVALSSKYWLTSVNIERGLQFKKAETVFLNTWHGVPMKTVGNAVKGRNDFNWQKTDYVSYSSEKEKEIYIRDFKANPTSMVASGLPRNDELFNAKPEDFLMARKDLNLNTDKKIIVYAPTWRENLDVGGTDKIDIKIDWNLWEKELGQDYVLLLRAHPYTTKLLGVKFNDFVKDYSDYPAVNDLLLAADILISDYSSILYDYAILEKPLICFAYDYQDYKESRGFNFDPKLEMPEGILESQEEVLDKIKNMDYKEAATKVRAFREKTLTYGGNATNICIDLLFKEFYHE